MTNQELDNIIKNLKTIPDGNGELARTILKAAADSITLDRIKALTAPVASVEDKTEQIESMNGSEILVFSQKEINSMPRTFRKQFRCKGITAHVHKRRSGKIEYKKIPITPMLRPYLTDVEEIKFSSLRIIRDRFNKIFPEHKLYDLRTTFYTRCQECGVADVARNEFVGHLLGALGNAYTDLSDEFLIREGNKLNY